jgi:hypothetical protein
VLSSDPIAPQEPRPDAPTDSPRRPASPDEAGLLGDLQNHAREIQLDSAPGTSAKLLGKAADGRKATAARAAASLPEVLARRPDLAGLPVLNERECKASEEATANLDAVSGIVRFLEADARLLGIKTKDDADEVSARDQYLVKNLADEKDLLTDDHAPGLAQMLCAETKPVRLQLTKMLAIMKGPRASIALARQALFDLTPEVRDAAIQALKDRPREEYRQALLDGLRYPWPPVADHAAAALTAVDDRAAAKELARMLTLPDPSAPMLNEKRKWVVPELVKINHLRNCLLCHAPSFTRHDPVRGFIPVAGQEIPVSYYAQPDGEFVRADITYIKQDFSVTQPVADPGKWPKMQRFDYLVRHRELTGRELGDVGGRSDPGKPYPQREAVRFALAILTSAKADPSSPSGSPAPNPTPSPSAAPGGKTP